MLELLKNNEFDDVYSIMEDSFPEDERRPYDEQKMLLNKENYHIYVVKNTIGRISAFIAVWNFKDFIFLEHFAVDSSLRNSGIGSRVLKDIKSKYNKIICLEVEHPESEITRRRVGFYERN
ncbi:MAG: GNAT family N-acetyltransferase, partial [Clostridia bacterium]|nr:GNAT family N-acetyltransferase [Clostridia bacterium]